MAVSMEQIEKWASNPMSMPTAGSYGEGLVGYGMQALQQLKSAVQKGEMTLTDYMGYAEPITKRVAQFGNAVSSMGSKQANAISAAGFGEFLNGGYAKNLNGQWTATLPFTRTEYAKLSNDVLPTQQDISNGLFDPLIAPMQRIRQSPTPQVNPGPGNVTPGTTTPTNQTGNAPLYTANPNSPAPYGGLQSTNSEASFDAQKIAQEAALQQQLAQQALEARATQRKNYLNDLSGILMQQQNQAFSESNPVIQEELNAKGLLRSSELGNALARELKSLQGVTSSQLAKYSTDAEMADLNDLKGIQDSYNQARNSALQRQFSVEDYNRQIDAGIRYGQEMSKLTPNQGKSGSPGGTAIGTLAGGVGGAFLGGPAGAAAGAQIGGTVGNSTGK